MASTSDRDCETVELVDSEAFAAELAALLQRARENGVAVDGGWATTTETDRSETWDVVITPVERDESARYGHEP